MREIKFRGVCKKSGKWVYGEFRRNAFNGTSKIIKFGIAHEGCYPIEVMYETVGQLRYVKDGVEYYDGDIYYHAGYGNEIVSDFCEIHTAVLSGHSDDIGEVIGNIHEGGKDA
jgi:hypothetical protein